MKLDTGAEGLSDCLSKLHYRTDIPNFSDILYAITG
jgi:hypothetical protein